MTLYSTVVFLLLALMYSALTFGVGLAAYVQMKNKKEDEEGEWSRRNRLDYFRFQ